MTGSRLDPWIDSLCTAGERHDGFGDPGIVRCRFPPGGRIAGRGMPYVEALPMEAIAGTVAHLLATRGTAGPAVRQRPRRSVAA